MHSTTRLLASGWTFTRIEGGQGTGDAEWLETSTFPTSVHVELLHSRKIPDPVSTANGDRIECAHLWQFVGLHEWDVQCTCRLTFELQV